MAVVKLPLDKLVLKTNSPETGLVAGCIAEILALTASPPPLSSPE